jgi:heterodisulfide reductase subunit A-like polyferredoxin
MQAHQNGTPMLASSGFIAQVDRTACMGCGDCQAYCQFNAVSIGDEFARVDYDACMGCGVCESHCEQGAITLIQDESKGIPLEIMALIQQ